MVGWLATELMGQALPRSVSQPSVIMCQKTRNRKLFFLTQREKSFESPKKVHSSFYKKLLPNGSTTAPSWHVQKFC